MRDSSKRLVMHEFEKISTQRVQHCTCLPAMAHALLTCTYKIHTEIGTEGNFQPRELLFSIYSCTCMLTANEFSGTQNE